MGGEAIIPEVYLTVTSFTFSIYNDCSAVVLELSANASLPVFVTAMT